MLIYYDFLCYKMLIWILLDENSAFNLYSGWRLFCTFNYMSWLETFGEQRN